MAKGKIIYPSGDPAAVTYTFAKQFDFGHEEGYLEADINTRMFDGTLRGYIGHRKKFFNLTFSYVSQAQRDALLLAYNVGADIDLYLDGVNLAGTVRIMTPPVPVSQAAFDESGDYAYSFDMNFEEV